jgi:hypothetical protein
MVKIPEKLKNRKAEKKTAPAGAAMSEGCIEPQRQAIW